MSSVYHLHIPRTGGVSLRQHIKPILGIDNIFSTHHEPLNSSVLESKQFVSGHFGLFPIEHMNNPYVFTILRDPVKRFISYYKYTKKIFENMNNLEYLEYCLYKNPEAYSNLQTKFLTGYTDIEKYNNSYGIPDKVINCWFLEGYSENVEEAFVNLEGIDVFTMDTINDIPKKISQELNIPNFSMPVTYNTSDPNMSIPTEFYDRIVELNREDIKLYDRFKTNS